MAALALVLVALGAWELLVRTDTVDALLLPPPTDVATALWTDRGALGSDLATTTVEVVVGLLAAIAIGAALGFGMHLFAPVRKALRPLVIGSQAVPVPVIAPLFILVLGFGLAPKVLIVALVCFLPVTVSALDGFASAPADLRRTMRTLNASPRAIFWRVELPWAAPRIFSGARIAAAYAAIAALFAEYAGGSGGLADSMHDQLDTGLVGAAVVLLAALALALFGAVVLLERVALPWAREG
jgi:NitT/TauT family transport system permease protein/putative hydroxymethylpyrimidine transport system permease protein